MIKKTFTPEQLDFAELENGVLLDAKTFPDGRVVIILTRGPKLESTIEDIEKRKSAAAKAVAKSEPLDTLETRKAQADAKNKELEEDAALELEGKPKKVKKVHASKTPTQRKAREKQEREDELAGVG